MYYILYEGLKIESNEPVYCTVYNVQCTMYSVHVYIGSSYQWIFIIAYTITDISSRGVIKLPNGINAHLSLYIYVVFR